MVRVVVVVQRQANLLENVLTVPPPRCFSRLLHGRKQQRHQPADDRHHHQSHDLTHACRVFILYYFK